MLLEWNGLKRFRRILADTIVKHGENLAPFDYDFILQWIPSHVSFELLEALDVLIVVHVGYIHCHFFASIIHVDMNDIQSLVVYLLWPNFHDRALNVTIDVLTGHIVKLDLCPELLIPNCYNLPFHLVEVNIVIVDVDMWRLDLHREAFSSLVIGEIRNEKPELPRIVNFLFELNLLWKV